jgi:hypothetical protein
LKTTTQIFEQPGGFIKVVNLSKLPFVSKRFFTVTVEEVGTERGHHAHKVCVQYLFVIHGKVRVELIHKDGQKHALELAVSDDGILISELVWSIQTYLEDDSILGVFASEEYDEADYIRDFEIFQRD